ncbi:hypothetical protein CVT25_006666 [Psilocybe cyanescens]|uniref:Reverse transcriptase domain-containing protein n=1 Tax=Psilocybe cyanescens TaxID=93625 RepID=A0A409XU35_PSICY|nr:hypothetical protein CVT25_006666 [Psilocybe cyanescens]
MDFAVKQRAEGLHLYRMHDDLWLWDSDPKKVANGWVKMNMYTELAGLRFNKKKLGRHLSELALKTMPGFRKAICAGALSNLPQRSPGL